MSHQLQRLIFQQSRRTLGKISRHASLRLTAATTKKGGMRQRPLSCLVSITPNRSRSLCEPVFLHPRESNPVRTNDSCLRPVWQLCGRSRDVRWFSVEGESQSKEGKKEKKKKKDDDKKKNKDQEKAVAADDDPAAAAAKEDSKSEESKAAESSSSSKATEQEEDDSCPAWQNPLHHNNPDKEKVFEEDFGPGEEMPIAQLPPFEDPNDPDKILASQEVHDLADEIVHLSMLEMKELITKIGDHFGFEKPPFTGSGGGGGGDGSGGGDDVGGEGEAEAAAAAKTSFEIKLVSFDASSKIKVIKEVRALAGLGLKEAKEMVEGAPKVVMKDISKEQAEELQKKLEDVGATVEIV